MYLDIQVPRKPISSIRDPVLLPADYCVSPSSWYSFQSIEMQSDFLPRVVVHKEHVDDIIYRPFGVFVFLSAVDICWNTGCGFKIWVQDMGSRHAFESCSQDTVPIMEAGTVSLVSIEIEADTGGCSGHRCVVRNHGNRGCYCPRP